MDRDDLRKAMQQAQEVQMDLLRAQQELAQFEVTGSSKDGLITVCMTAQGDYKDIRIDSSIMKEGHKAVEKSILEALKAATEKASQITKDRLSSISKQIGL